MLNILNVAQSGLKASQTQVENVMNNLVNEHTPGYKKRNVNVSELEHADARLTGRGVSLQGVERNTNIYMYQNLITEESKLSSINHLNTMLSDMESIFYETDTSGLSADINRYFRSIENLRTSPQNEVYKNDLSNNAKVIVSDLQNLYKGIEDAENRTLLNVRENVSEVNNLLKEIGNISKKISETTTGTPNDLLDKRDNLEKELAKYVDVEISRDAHYQLKIGGVTAVRFDTNVHEIKLIENYTPQKDIYAKLNNDGTTKIPLTDGLIDKTTWVDAGTSEVQTIDMSGIATGPVMFLGHEVVGSIAGDTATDTATKIVADKADIITNWNKNFPDKKIQDITSAGSVITITYDSLAGDVPAIDNTDSEGIIYTGSVETTTGKGSVDSLTYTLNNEVSLTVTRGEILLDDAGNEIDLDGDGILAGDDIVTENNVLQAMIYKINQSRDIGGTVKAYNGQYELAKDGSKILTNDPRHSDYDPANPNKDRYLVIESQIDGEKGSFVGEFLVNDSNKKSHPLKNEMLSKAGIDDIHLEIYDKEVSISGGALKPMLDNISTESGNNIYNQYKEKLDQFAKTLSNLSGSYIENADQSYIYGTDMVELNSDEDKKVNLNLFSGASVNSLKFNNSSLNTLTQDKLDYLATIQWKEDIDFDNTGLNKQSFSQFYQTLRVNIADNKENAAFTQGAQSAVRESLQNAYDKVTKVDKDGEMIELIKYQSAYEASAKMVTIVDEMLQTLLGMKR